MRNRIKEYREKKSISQGKLADLCNVSRQTINAILMQLKIINMVQYLVAKKYQ
ncbi:transcriptional regulator with XRE-family HTH domain [Gracilibacillus alcaliphilus]|nr:transcriptional regulator with XRE-family HTH domain [Gracilibacillus alcaliphilus]